MDRFALFLMIASVLAGAYLVFRRWQIVRLGHLVSVDPLLTSWQPGVPGVVYFTSPGCAPCQVQQKPALLDLQADLGQNIQVIEVNALDDPEAATRWGVLSVPTTFVLDQQGKPREVNYGVAKTDKLKQQLQAIR